jgi:imidazolonepropionase-like amidohydrolase
VIGRAVRIAARSALFALTLGSASASAATLIHAGRVIDAVGDKPLLERTVVVDAGKITVIEAGYRAAGPGDSIIDLRNGTLLPGLMDMHVHLTFEYSRSYELDRFTKGAADRALTGAMNAHKTLMAGFTTVRDLEDTSRASISLRNAINEGKVPGPRIFAAGKAIASTGGHADPTNGWVDSSERGSGPADGVINGPDDAAAAVRQRYKGRGPISSRSRRPVACSRWRRAASIRSSPRKKSARSSPRRATTASRWPRMRMAPRG